MILSLYHNILRRNLGLYFVSLSSHCAPLLDHTHEPVLLSGKFSIEPNTMELKAEDLHRHAFDRFVANSMIKTGYGFGIGLLFSLTLFRRRLLPIYLGTGSGFGFALSDFNKQLKSIK